MTMRRYDWAGFVLLILDYWYWVIFLAMAAVAYVLATN